MPSIRSSRVVVGGELRPAAIRYEDGVIADVFDGPADRDMGDLMILPGLVDSHVHVNEPGRTEWEGFETATMAAAAGGTTTIVDMPLNCIPPTVDVPSLDLKRRSADGRISVDVAFWGGVVPGSEPGLGDLAARGVCGFKMFMVDSGVDEFPPMPSHLLRPVLESLAALGLPALMHAESGDLLSPVAEPRSYLSYLESRPVSSEVKAVAELIGMAAATGGPVHVLHVSSGDAADLIGRSSLSGETCPHYLTFSAEEIPPGATQFKCAPPIRERRHREALWEALREGSISVVVSDHSPAPATLEQLDTGDFASAWGGISSLQLRLTATWHGARARGFGPVELAIWMAEEPARLAGLGDRKGAIGVGKDADLVVFDPDGETTVRSDRLHHRHPITPYDGMRLRGRVVETILRGITVYDGDVHGGRGRMLERHD